MYEKITFVLSVFLLFFAFLSGSPGLTGRVVSSAHDTSVSCGDYDHALELFLRQEYNTQYDIDEDNDLDARDLKWMYPVSASSCPIRHTCARVGAVYAVGDHVLRCAILFGGKRTLVLDEALS